MSERNPHITQLADHLFRREAGKMVAVLTRLFGTENLQMAEDVVQDTLLLAFNSWPDKGIPSNPTAWLYKVAKNKAIDKLRHNRHSLNTDPDDFSETHDQALPDITGMWKQELLEDDMLRMMFACCHPKIPKENQITLILKTLCGFSTIEIAKAFLIPEDTVSKRLYRTKEFFRSEKIKLGIPSVNELKKRTDVVLNAIYLLFNEGYNSTQSEYLIRKDLMDEAMLLCQLLIQNKNTQQPETYALMALMCFHASRSESRLSTEGEIILLSRQDRTRWDGRLITQGNHLMNQAAFGDTVSPYHLEAAIAFEHCTANSFDTTNWKRILGYYDWLCRIAPSPFTAINRAVALMQVDGPQAALTALQDIPGTEKFYLYHAILGEIYIRLHDFASARISLEGAISLTRAAAEKKILQEKLAAVLN
ncbi:sigma-70 family RNA polymerase sigma factor [Mucilaginibacter mali]|uniref:RNA polymerase sigma factor n=1 Tax=Mucilaginibacter mali TaxID=2740462 RepID=A0A7D4UP50_9SPHI|nr:sigma-70 family RNA polymerase sigma factor [Mucilaginibacter mali]QKJ29780.1 sigma-70 family RNA polymerase sigma factor [Mucilaginibacter mali]